MLLRGLGDGMLVYHAIRQYIAPNEKPGSFLSKFWSGPEKPLFKAVFGKSNVITSPSFLSVSDELLYLHVFEEDYSFWNFRPPANPKQGVIIHPRSEGFFDLAESVSVARLVILASNLVGFRG